MPYTLIKKTIVAVAVLAPVIALSVVFAAGPHSRTAPGDELDFPAPVFGISGASDDSSDSIITDADEGEARGNSLVLKLRAAQMDATVDAPAEEDSSAAEATWDQAHDLQGEIRSSDDSGLSPRMLALRDKLRDTLGYYHQKRLNTRDHNPWEVMHSIVAYGVHSQLNRNGPDGAPVNAISWLCWNGDCHGTRILEVTGGRVAARKGPQVQGHPGQFLAILAQGCVATNCPIKIGDKRFTLVDLIESEKRGCEAGTELTFKLISFSYYLDIDERWKNEAGENWSIARLVHEELSQPVVGAACGGTHRLMGLAYAVRKREASGLPLTGEFRRAKKYLDDYHRYTLTKLQNADGSFSTEWFKAPGARPDLARRIQTSGHILEWLSYSLPVEMLLEDRVVRAAEYLTDIMHDKKGSDWEVGPLGHALHSLAIYDSRVFKPYDHHDLADIVAAGRAAPGTIPLESAQLDQRGTRSAVKAAPEPPRMTRADMRKQTQRSDRRATRP